MASGEHSCTRRALLGVAVGARVLTLPSLAAWAPSSAEMGEGSEGRWPSAVAALNEAEAGMRAAEGGTAGSWEAQCAMDELFSDRVVLFNRAAERLLRVPAPDSKALALKLALAIDEQAWELPDGEECMAALKRDAARLAGG